MSHFSRSLVATVTSVYRFRRHDRFALEINWISNSV